MTLDSKQLEQLKKEVSDATKCIPWEKFREGTCIFCRNTKEFMEAILGLIKEMEASRKAFSA